MVECLDVSLQELYSLSVESRTLGCQPSLNIYDGMSQIDVPPGFPTRSAGGHIHLGLQPPIWGRRGGAYSDERRTLIPMFDMVVGNTCVLLNTGTEQAHRRLTYGKAGEYRLPAHGAEYRPLSNFWLRDYVLLQFVFGMAHFTVDVLTTSLKQSKPLDDQLMRYFTVEGVRAAIDKNDPTLAMKNFDSIAGFLEEHGRAYDPLNRETLPRFRNFLRKSNIEREFPAEGVMERWINTDLENTWFQFISRF